MSAAPKRSNVLFFRPKPYKYYSASRNEALQRLVGISGNEQLRHPRSLEDFEALERMGFLQGKDLEDLERLRVAHAGIEFVERYDHVIEECFELIINLDRLIRIFDILYKVSLNTSIPHCVCNQLVMTLVFRYFLVSVGRAMAG